MARQDQRIRRGDPDVKDTVTGIETDDSDGPIYHEPAAQPTAFGAATVGGAVAASAMAGPGRSQPHGPRDEEVVTDQEGAMTPAADSDAVDDRNRTATRSAP